VRKEIAAPPRTGSPGASGSRSCRSKPPICARNVFLVLFERAWSWNSIRGRPASHGERGKAAASSSSKRVWRSPTSTSKPSSRAGVDQRETQGLHEELLSSNEELQSINEEFETAKEELQSTNEELITSAEEISRGNQILNRANSDLSNLLANINIPIVLLGPDLNVRRITPSAERVLGLSSKKVGRSIDDIKLPLRVPNLKQLLLNVIKTGYAQELEVQDTRGRWYYLFLRPYRTDKSKTERSRVEGAVMALVDIHDRKLSEKTVLRLVTVVRDSNDAVIIRDLKDRIIAWNRGAEKMYGYTEAEALGMSIGRLIPGDRRMREREMVQVSAQGREASPIETRRCTKDGRTLDVLLTVTALRDEKGRPVELATTERDITERKRAEREFRRLHTRAISSQETERKRLARELHDGVGQILSGVKFRLESLPGRIEGIPEEAEREITRAGGIIDRAISETRRVSQNLMPAELEDLGLQPALTALCRDVQDRLCIRWQSSTWACRGISIPSWPWPFSASLRRLSTM